MAELWQIDIRPTARRDLDQLADERGDSAYDEVLQDIMDLDENPLPNGSVHLRGTKDFYRIYTYRSVYRIIYRVLFGKQKVLIVRVRPRRSVYSGFDGW